MTPCLASNWILNCYLCLFSARVMSLVNKTDPDWVVLGNDAGPAGLQRSRSASPLTWHPESFFNHVLVDRHTGRMVQRSHHPTSRVRSGGFRQPTDSSLPPWFHIKRQPNGAVDVRPVGAILLVQIWYSRTSKAIHSCHYRLCYVRLS